MKTVVGFAVAGLTALVACNGQFRFDEPPADAGVDVSSPPDAAVESAAPVSASCGSEVDCTKYGLHCDEGSASCVACVEDVQCTSDRPRCDTAAHRCVECGTNTDCGADRRCEPRTHRCYATCSEQAPTCPTGFECDEDDFRCQRCEHDDTCAQREPSAPHCDPQLRVCVECTADTQCGATARHCDRTRGRCVECINSAQCAAERPVCLADGTCSAR